MSVSRLMSALLVVLALTVATAPHVPAQDDPPPVDAESIDDLFGAEDDGSADEEPDAPGSSGESADGDSADGPADTRTVLDELLAPEPLAVVADLRVAAGYSGGWSDRFDSYDQLPVITLASGLDLSLTFSSILELTQSVRVAWPAYELVVDELVVDYTPTDTLFLTAGLTRVVWGRSPTFPHANLPQRRAANPLSPAEATGALVLRARVPVGIGGFELLLQNKAEYQEEPSTPRVERIAAGLAYNLAVESFDLDAGAYYQRGMPGRAFLAAATTVTDWFELYGEATVADDRLRADPTGPERAADGEVELTPGVRVYDNNPDYAASAGAVFSLAGGLADLNVEYFYNGEESEGTVVGSRFPLLWGHNAALNVDTDFDGLPLRLRAGMRYNVNLASGLFAPRLTYRPGSHVAVDAVGAYIWGDPEAGYAAANPDPLDRSLVFALTVTVSGRM